MKSSTFIVAMVGFMIGWRFCQSGVAPRSISGPGMYVPDANEKTRHIFAEQAAAEWRQNLHASIFSESDGRNIYRQKNKLYIAITSGIFKTKLMLLQKDSVQKREQLNWSQEENSW